MRTEQTQELENITATWSGLWMNDVYSPAIGFDEARRRLALADTPLGKVQMIAGIWAVTNDGVECLTWPYFIERSRIDENSFTEWVNHVSQKTWMQGFERDIEDALLYCLPDECLAASRPRSR